MSSVNEPDLSEETASDPSAESSSGSGLTAWTESVQDMAPYLDLGWRLTGAAAGPPLLGYFCVDLWLGTTPWGVLGGAVLGITTAGVKLRQLQRTFGGKTR